MERKNPLAWKAWPPYWVGALIGVLSWFAFASAQHPIGITTSFENTSALLTKGVTSAAQPQVVLLVVGTALLERRYSVKNTTEQERTI